MAIPDVDKLYECGSVLSTAKATDFPKYEDQFKTILNGVKGDSSTKKLTSQFVSRFFSKYPALANDSLDAILDLCEDEEVDIRKQAIKDLPTLCREMKEFLPKIADVLSQLLQTDDKGEVVVIQNSLMSLFRRDAKGTLIGLFSQVRTGGDVVRDRALKFLHLKLKTDGNELIASKDTESILLQEIKLSMEDCTADEFQIFLAMLGATSLPKTVSGQSMIVELIAHSCQLHKDQFDATDDEAADRLIHCANAALPYFSSQVRSTQFADFLCNKVLPAFGSLEDTIQTQILKLLAEVCMFTGKLQKPLEATEAIYKLLMDAVPQKQEATDTTDDFEFTKLECLLLAFHTVASQAPNFLTDNPELLKDFKTRLQYFALAIQGYIRKLDEFIKNKSKVELSKEENQVRVVAHRSAKNISTIIKDLFKIPPSYKSKVIVSWRDPHDKVAMAAGGASGEKRRSISFEAPIEKKKPSMASSPQVSKKRPVGNSKVYAPPQGKYSSNIGRVVDDDDTSQQSYGKRGRGGGFRGRGGRGGGGRGGRFYR